MRKLQLSKGNDLLEATQLITGRVRTEPRSVGLQGQRPSTWGAVVSLPRPGCWDKAGAARTGRGRLCTGKPQMDVAGYPLRQCLCSDDLHFMAWHQPPGAEQMQVGKAAGR